MYSNDYCKRYRVRVVSIGSIVSRNYQLRTILKQKQTTRHRAGIVLGQLSETAAETMKYFPLEMDANYSIPYITYEGSKYISARLIDTSRTEITCK